MADTIRTQADLINNIFPDNQAAGSITAQDMRDFASSVQHITPLGWQFFFDVTYPDENNSRLITPAGLRTQIEIAPFLTEDLLYPTQSPLAWNSANNEDGSGILNRVNPQLLNGFGLIRLSFAAWQNSQNSYIDVEFDVSASGLGNVIYHHTNNFIKGTGQANHQHFNYVIPVFLGSDFATNGGRFYITATGGTVNMFQTTLTLTNTFAPNAAGPG